MKTRYFAYLLSATILAGAPLAPVVAQGDSSAAEQSRSFSIPAGRLSQGVLTLSEQGGVQIVFDSDATGNVEGKAVSGTMTLGQALDRLVSGTGLRWRWLRSGVVTIENASGAGGVDGELVTGVVSVEGYQGSPYFGGAGVAAGVNGINGSRDITATEGTKSFTSGALTVGSKAPQAMKEVPQAVSVLTNERMAQQNVTDLTGAMNQLPGVTLVQGDSSLSTTFLSRGFAIESFQIDGGAPLTTLFGRFNTISNGANPYVLQIDMAQYDHVELLRGAAGLFNGFGDPSGTVNLVRKKPLDHAQFLAEASVGSWNNYRLVVDASSPLALEGKLRGRLVISYQDREYFYDIAEDNKTLIYGIAEWDAAPSTLVTAGMSYTRQHNKPWVGGLPRYTSGADIELPRSTSLMTPWSRWDLDTLEIFGSVKQAISEDWFASLNLTHNRQDGVRKAGYGFGAVNPLNGRGVRLAGGYAESSSEQFSAEALLSGSFELFGQRQEIAIGASRASSDAGGTIRYESMITSSPSMPYQPYPGGPTFCNSVSCTVYSISPPIDPFNFDPFDPLYSEPLTPLANVYAPAQGSVQWGTYFSMRFTPFERFHISTGLRWSFYKENNVQQYLCWIIPTEDPGYSPSCYGKNPGDFYAEERFEYKDNDINWPPQIGASYDLTDELTAHLSYASISFPNTIYANGDRELIDPITGADMSVALKWAPAGGKMNAALSIFKIRQKGFSISDNEDRYSYENIDPDNYIYYYIIDNQGNQIPNGLIAPGVECCFLNDENAIKISQGFELELTGEVIPGLQMSASYTFNDNLTKGTTYGDTEGLPFISIQPKHNYKLWMSYDFGVAGKVGWLSGLTLSLGVNGQSSAYNSGSVCIDPNTPNPNTGISSCKPGGTVPFEFTVPSYAVFSGRVDYRFSDRWSLGVNLENIFDKTYYQSVGRTTGGNWYGAPRSFIATLRTKW